MPAIQNNWQQFIKLVGNQRPSISSVLEKANLKNFDGTKLTISLGSEGSIVSNQRYWLENRLSELLQTTIRLEIKVKNAPEKQNKPEKKGATKKEIMEQILSKSDQLRKLVDEFDLEVM